MRTIPVVVGVGAAALFAIACSDAPNTVTGGLYLLDAGAPMSTSSSSGSDMMINPNLPMNCTAGGANSGNTWSDLYACYFSPMGISGCAGSPGACHTDLASAGGSTWVCGMTQQSCRQGLIAGSLTTGTASMMDMDALLYSQVCHVDSTGMETGVMPLGCANNMPQWLLPTDMARIQAWLQAGAPDN